MSLRRLRSPLHWWCWRTYWLVRWYVFPRLRYDTYCQYCGVKTSTTMHDWATEDVCRDCDVTPEHVVETGNV